jgi:FtsP/CotA-like multicopper oxidase with cupredoxin domain
VNRRDFIKIGSAGAASFSAARLLGTGPQSAPVGTPVSPDTVKADFTLRIAPVVVDLTPNRLVSTIGYNGTSPGPLLRMREGKPVTVNVINDTDVPELVHWHGLYVPSEVDGADEEGTPMIPPRGRRQYQFTPRPAGARWYHTHTMAMDDLHRGAYTGQFGFLYVEPEKNPGNYDQELFLALRDWEPLFIPEAEEDESQEGNGPQPERPQNLDTSPAGFEVNYQMYSINSKSLGAGEPIRVRPGDRVLLHFLNASPSLIRTLALPGHKFLITALDGNPVPSPKAVEAIQIAPGERVDAIVEMNSPGRLILGVTQDEVRMGGMGIMVEYANRFGQPVWMPPANPVWDYTQFGGTTEPAKPDQTIEMIFEKVPSGAGRFNLWHVNGKEYPHEQEFVLKQGARHRLVFRNRSEDAHPLHIHRHLFELVDVNGKPTSGIMKDTVMVPMYGRATVDLVADQPGLTLFHCHIQQHMDYGFKALFRYSSEHADVTQKLL